MRARCNGLNETIMNFDELQNMDFDFDTDSFPTFCKYPYHGAFYRYAVDENKPLDEQTDEEILVYETDCNILRRAGLRQSNLVVADYNIRFPLEPNPEAKGAADLYKDCGVRRGYTFKGVFYGVEIEGQIEMIEPSQLGEMNVDIKVVTENGSDNSLTAAGQ